MGRQIIKQPNGLFCIFSTIVDSVIRGNCSEQDIVDFLIQDAAEDIKENVNKIITKLNNGEKPYRQFTMTYEEMLDHIADVHGINKANEICDQIEKTDK